MADLDGHDMSRRLRPFAPHFYFTRPCCCGQRERRLAQCGTVLLPLFIRDTAVFAVAFFFGFRGLFRGEAPHDTTQGDNQPWNERDTAGCSFPLLHPRLVLFMAIITTERFLVSILI